MAKPQQMLFHLGFQKTGTTSIQALLNANRARLTGIDIRAYGDATKDLRVAGRTYCADPTPKREARLRDALRGHVDRFRSGDDAACLISDENILGRVAYGPTGDVLSWGKRILPMIEEAAAGLDLQFVFYTRAQAAWRSSIYKQSVKRAGETRSLEGWSSAAPFTGDWPDWSDWQQQLQGACAAPVEFLSMEEEIASDLPLGAGVLRRLGVSDADIAELATVSPQNTSLSERAICLMRMINHLPLSDRRRLKISEYIEARDRRGGAK